METFFLFNGVELTASNAEYVPMFINLAAGNLCEESLGS